MIRLLLIAVLTLLFWTTAQTKGQALNQEAANSWAEVDIPSDWTRSNWTQPRNGASENGFRWYRCVIKPPTQWAGKNLELYVEPVDDAREVYLNGVKIASVGAMPPKFRSGLGEDEKHTVSAKHFIAGEENVLAIRVYRKYPRGGFNVAAPIFTDGNKAISTKGKWQYIIGDNQDYAQWKTEDREAFRYDQLADAKQILESFKQLANDRGPQTPSDALAQFETTDGLTIDAVLTDPDIAQPLSFKFDERGRLWVMEYKQYPNPAGLTAVSRDKYLRTVYDKMPLPPPHGDKGQDQISIHEDTDGDGAFDKHSVFVDGLSIATSFAMGDGGVYVMNPPYLLFYEDKDKDDRADGDPKVILEGFGIEDSHSCANNLRWGPDGWLYAAQGSTVSGNIKHYGTDEKPIRSMGQCIWRYHPQLKKYEVFAEGGGNTFGVEFDSHGRVYSGYNGGNTRGFHYIQGGYYLKGFSKHGQLSNPYAFGYFPAMTHNQVPRFTHTFVIYEDPTLPKGYQNKLFGIEPIQGRVVYSDVQGEGSTFKTEDLGFPLKTTDTWFRPVDIQVGPDGAIYVADLYEQRIDHASHYQGRVDKTNGRIYRLRPSEDWKPSSFDVADWSNQELFGLFKSDIRLHRQIAIRLLKNRRLSKDDLHQLHQLFHSDDALVALNALWTYQITGHYNLKVALSALTSPHDTVRSWSIRLAADHLELDEPYQAALVRTATSEPSVHVRSQLAATARRVPSQLFADLTKALLYHGEDLDDKHVPLMLWWAVEANAHQYEVLKSLFEDASIWNQELTQDYIIERLAKRYAMSGKRQEYDMLTWLFEQAPDDDSRSLLLKGFEESFEGRSLGSLPEELLSSIRRAGGGSLVLRVRLGQPEAITQALTEIANTDLDASARAALIGVFGQIKHQAAVPTLLNLVRHDDSDQIVQASLLALQSFESNTIALTVLEAYSTFNEETQIAAQSLLVSRETWLTMLLDMIEMEIIDADSISQESVLKIVLFDNKELQVKAEKHFGKVTAASAGELQRRINDLVGVIGEASGNPYDGKQLYLKHCGKCHQLFTDGGNIGPNLTTYKRDDLQTMLLNVVNPSLAIREGFENYAIFTLDGRTLSGFIDDQDNRVVVLRSNDGQRTVINRDDIDEMQAIPRSIMPEGILKTLKPQEIRDLFAYLRASQPLP